MTDLSNYSQFVARKLKTIPPVGLSADPGDYGMFPHQRDLVRFGIRRGRAAIFADTGLGKTRMQTAWADVVRKETGSDVLIKWQTVASPVWMDIDPSDTLQYTSAREHDDERHICPLQLEVIRRGIDLWTNPGDVVLSPFAGIGSEGHVAIQMGRKYVGVELKRSYYEQAARNLQNALKLTNDLFAEVA